MASFESSTPFAKDSKWVTTDKYDRTRAQVAVSYPLTHSSTQSSRQTPKVAAPAMIWFFVIVEMNVPIANNPPAWSNSPRYPIARGFQSGLPYLKRNAKFSAVNSSRQEYSVTAASHFPMMTSMSRTGDVANNSMVPVRFSSAKSRIVIIGMKNSPITLTFDNSGRIMYSLR